MAKHGNGTRRESQGTRGDRDARGSQGAQGARDRQVTRGAQSALDAQGSLSAQGNRDQQRVRGARNAQHTQVGKRIWKAAGYSRLSVDDGDGGGSASIVSQKKMIARYAEEHDDVQLVANYEDDGWSGSSFDRPGFNAVMAAIEAGMVDCIIVKDLSRFGRNYLEAGRYLERVLPEKGVRLIALNDGYDSLREGTSALGLQGDDALIVPFKNLINDWYCANASTKTKEALAVRRRAGLFVGSFAPYGFQKDERDHNVLLPDPDAAPIVRRIFTSRACGETLTAIADSLNADGILSPSALKASRGCKQPRGVATASSASPKWHASQVRKILLNEMYAGVMVQGKSFSPSFRSAVRLGLPADRWERVPGACPAIVDADLFDAAQRAGGLRWVVS